MKSILLYFALLLVCTSSLEGVVQLNDNNFKELVYAEPKFWLVMFSATWCGHCTQLKPQIEHAAVQLAELGVTVGHVDEKNSQLVNQFVVDHKTHMVSYPKLKVFLGEQQLDNVPPGFRSAHQIVQWFKSNFGLESAEAQL